MDEDIILDAEFKRYLKIIKPYLEQLLDKDIIEICNAWIHKLISCDGVEKTQRNKYIFTLCYQLAIGSLNEPFTKFPTPDELTPLSDEAVKNDDSSEVECLIGSTGTEMFMNQKNSDTLTNEVLNDPDVSQIFQSSGNSYESMSISKDDNRCTCFTYPEIKRNTYLNIKTKNSTFGNRAKNLILKLRNMKKENSMLHNQILSLKDETMKSHDYSFSKNRLNNNASNSCHNMKHNSDSRINLIETISNLQENLEHFNKIKKYEIDSLVSKHNLEILEAKTATKMEIMESYEKKILELTNKYENCIENIRLDHTNTLEHLRIENDSKISRKDEIIKSRDIEISHLKKNLEDLQSQYNKSLSQSSQKLEDRLNKIEKSRIKYAKAYETKISNLEREKHMNECSLQLQLIKQKAQIINDNTDEIQSDLVKALEKLEGKYKDIIATVQATAVQRRIQDQIVLESLIKTICDVPNEGNFNDCSQPNNVTNLMRATPATNILRPPHKVGIIDKSLKREEDKDDDTISHDNRSLGKDIETLHIPQRDMANILKK